MKPNGTWLFHDFRAMRKGATPLTDLNRRTTAKWLRCKHRYDGRTVIRDVLGEVGEYQVCARCGVPDMRNRRRTWNRALMAEDES